MSYTLKTSKIMNSIQVRKTLSFQRNTIGIEQKNTDQAQIQMIEMYFIIISSLLYGKRQYYYFYTDQYIRR